MARCTALDNMVMPIPQDDQEAGAKSPNVQRMTSDVKVQSGIPLSSDIDKHPGGSSKTKLHSLNTSSSSLTKDSGKRKSSTPNTVCVVMYQCENIVLKQKK